MPVSKSSVRNVLIVSDFADVTGGQAKVAIESARLLADAGLSVTFFAATGPVSPLLDHPRIATICLGHRTLLEDPNRLRAMVRGLWNLEAARALGRAVSEFSPRDTVLHCHGWAKALSPSVGRVLASGRLPVLYTMHEYFLACPNGGFFDYPAQRICTRKPLSPACLARNCDARRASHKAWRVLRAGLARSLGRLPAGLRDIAYISEVQRAAIAPYLPARARLHHLPNPVEAAGPPVDAGANSDFVFVGRLSPEKGGVLFAEAARLLDVPAVFVGDGPEADRIRFVNPDARITGWVSPDAVQEHLSRARALVFPSLWYEGQPLAPIEALLRGVPVVCGRWTAAREAVLDGQNGILYDAPSVEDLAGAMRRVRSIQGFDASQLARAVSPTRHLERVLGIYEEMLSR